MNAWFYIIIGGIFVLIGTIMAGYGWHKQSSSDSKRPSLSKIGQHNERSLVENGVLLISQFEYKNTGKEIAENVKFHALAKQGSLKKETTLGDKSQLSIAPEEKMKFEINKILLPMPREKLNTLRLRHTRGESIDLSKEVNPTSPIYLELELKYSDQEGKLFSDYIQLQYDMKINQWVIEEEK